MTRYCLGFVFTTDRDRVLLIEKHKPEWMKGQLNGIGGKVEAGESSLVAMVREMREETGLEIHAFRWRRLGAMKFGESEVDVFMAVADLTEARSLTPEQVVTLNVRNVPHAPVVPNLRWLVPYALDAERSNMVDFEARGL